MFWAKLFLCRPTSLKISIKFKCANNRNVSYVQGHSPEPKIREYFYFIDHQGMLFLDDARMKNFTSCFKAHVLLIDLLCKPSNAVVKKADPPKHTREKKFLIFFFKHVCLNKTGRYEDSFPFVSLCGRERNYIRCDDVPAVFTNVIKGDGQDLFCYGHAGPDLSIVFEPNHIYMNPATGRVYHPAPENFGSIGLVQSKLAIEFSKRFQFDNGEHNAPTHFTWQNEQYSLDNKWTEKVEISIRNSQ